MYDKKLNERAKKGWHVMIPKNPTRTEIEAFKIIPAIRRDIIRVLVDDYQMRQSKIAKKLGLTEASVSQYLSGKRASTYKVDEISDYIQEIARIISFDEKHNIPRMIEGLLKKYRIEKGWKKTIDDMSGWRT